MTTPVGWLCINEHIKYKTLLLFRDVMVPNYLIFKIHIDKMLLT